MRIKISGREIENVGDAKKIEIEVYEATPAQTIFIIASCVIMGIWMWNKC